MTILKEKRKYIKPEHGNHINLNHIIHQLKTKYNTTEIIIRLNTATYLYVFPISNFEIDDNIDINKINIFYYNTKIGEYSIALEITITNLYEELSSAYLYKDQTNIHLMFLSNEYQKIYKKYTITENLNISLIDKTIYQINKYKDCYRKSYKDTYITDRWDYRLKMIIEFSLFDFDDRKKEVLIYLRDYYSKENNEINNKIIETIDKHLSFL